VRFALCALLWERHFERDTLRETLWATHFECYALTLCFDVMLWHYALSNALMQCFDAML
jgi:hypothetical protein